MIRRPPTQKRTKPRPCLLDCYAFPHRVSGGRCVLNKDGTFKYPPIDLPGVSIPELD